MTAQQQAGPFASAVVAYHQAGWPCVLPITSPGAKHPPPIGFTGADGIDTAPEQLAVWAANGLGAHNIALRLPEGVIGIDVDQYEKAGKHKQGAITLAAHRETWGELPASWSSTSRDPNGPSRIYFYRAPAGRYATGLSGGDVDIIQRHHRYVVVAPSINPETQLPYVWYDPAGNASERVPSPHEFAELPAAWVAGLAEGATNQSAPAADREAGWVMLEQLREDTRVECREVTDARMNAVALVNAAEVGGRHDTMTARVHHLVQLGASGHPGVGHALLELSITWDALTAGELRGKEFADMMLTSARKAVTAVGPHQLLNDPCLSDGAYLIPGASPEGLLDEHGEPVEPIEPPRWWSVRETIGAHAFDPIAQLDQPLAQAVLERTYPVIRHAYDAGGWLLRVPGRWELHGDMTSWAVAQVASLMPIGDPTAEKGSEEYTRSARRARFNTQAGSRAIAGKMGALVAGGMHPCAIKLADLDREPDLLWAGGYAFDLRKAGAETPVETWIADARTIDPNTPHLHSAAVPPQMIPTPLWDAFLAAVWPDEEIRAWALRVLSICLTGYSDKVLPILIGEKDRGKTQVITLLMSMLGSYAHAADSRLLSPAGEKSHASILFALKGRRLSFIDEGPREGRQNTERLKQLTGGGELTANQMNQNPISFAPTHTLVLTTNDEPTLTDPAVRGRVRLIPCNGDPEQVIAARAAIGHTSSTAWRAEAPGVLAKMMVEAGAWLADPSSALTAAAPESIRYLAEYVGAEQDPVMVWVTEETEYFEAGTPSRELYGAFVASCRRNNVRADTIPTETRWGRTLNNLGYVARHTEHGKRRPIRIRQSDVWAPAPTPTPGEAAQRPADGLTPNPDEFLHGSQVNPSGAFPQVNHAFTEQPDGSDGLENLLTHTHTQARAQEAPIPNQVQPDSLEEPIPGLTCENTPVEASAEPDSQPDSPEVGPSDPSRATDLQPVPDETPAGVVAFDLETADAAKLCSYGPGFVRLSGHTHAGEVRLTAATDDLARYLERADLVVGHNVLGFDLLALARYHGLDMHAMVERGAVFDTLLAARQLDPPRARTNKKYDLDTLAARMGYPGKAHDLKKLAKEFGGYDRIPLDDSRYREYLDRDVRISLGVYAKTAINDPYLVREHRVAALAGQITLNGFRVDRDLLDERLAGVQQTKANALDELANDHGIPLTTEKGAAMKSPLATNAGKAALEEAFTRLGVDQLPRTAKTGVLTTSGDTMTALGKRYPQAARLCELIGTVTGARTIYGTIDAHTISTSDGWRVHPGISFEQSTGRASTTSPGLTVVGKRGERYHERDVFLADPGEVMLSVDLAQVDARAVAGLSGDPAYIAMFAPGRDLHAEIAERVWRDPSRREHAKAIGHGWNYGMGLARLAGEASVDISAAQQFDLTMRSQFPRLVEWRDEVRAIAAGGFLLDNGFGRKMNPDPERAHTQGPAFMGQGAARDLMMEGLLRLPREIYSMLRAIVHDEVVMSVPKDIALEVAHTVTDAMSFEWRGVPIIAEPQKAKDGSIRFGQTWGSLYAKDSE